MILIADSGSTKTDWAVVEQGQLTRLISTKGINPFFQTRAEIISELQMGLVPHLDVTTLDAVYFYGAGCTPERVPILKGALSDRLQVKEGIFVYSDMLAVARAMCGKTPGIACILGTGSNSCFYNGTEIVQNVSPLGFILGDEGSGATLGKLLVGDILKGQQPTEVREKFFQRFKLTPAEIIDRVYRQPFPNRFLASLSPFLAENIAEPTLNAIVLSSFDAFFQRNVIQYNYQAHPVQFVGSVAFYYQNSLRKVAANRKIMIGNIVKSPIQGLIEYHSSPNAPITFI